ncbi:hypothetical protein LEP1GSC108_0106 [Leptospira weilii str. UI 13098]|uniref:Uncharacterized protein n=1 Tax=Leptospira weilii str. UI 13098 TaxID=1088542 RepID=M6Q7J0_9LEPT|nr:hypothetical protein [Leptospira weilii]EMN89135.1 hypothetical protein LEP1GSC108_0106 [Leptospira weilii str. UI 13098]
MENGVFIDELKSNGLKTDLRSDKVQAFALEYLGAVKSSGALEFSKLIDVEKENGESEFKDGRIGSRGDRVGSKNRQSLYELWN